MKKKSKQPKKPSWAKRIKEELAQVRAQFSCTEAKNYELKKEVERLEISLEHSNKCIKDAKLGVMSSIQRCDTYVEIKCPHAKEMQVDGITPKVDSKDMPEDVRMVRLLQQDLIQIRDFNLS